MRNMRTTSEVIVCIITSYRKVMGSAHSLKCFSLQRVSLILHFFLFHNNVLFLYLGWKSLASITRTVNLNSHSCLLQWQKSLNAIILGEYFHVPHSEPSQHNVLCPRLTETAWVSEKRAPVLPESVTASKYIQWDPIFFGKMLLLFLWSIVFFRMAQLCLLCTIPNKLIDVEGKPGKSLLHPILHVPRSKIFNNCPDGEYIFSFLFSIYFFFILHYYWVACMLFTSFYSL